VKKSNPGGRPKLDNPRTKVVRARLTESEFQTFSDNLEESGLKVFEALRLLVLNAQLPKKIYSGVAPQAAAAWVALQPLQSNLNQLAHWFNSNKVREISIDDARRVGAVISRVESLVKQLRHEILTAPGAGK